MQISVKTKRRSGKLTRSASAAITQRLCSLRLNVATNCCRVGHIYLSPPPGGIAIRRVCWLVCVFVSSCVR